MIKSKQVPITWGMLAPGGAGKYCSAISGGSYTTFKNRGVLTEAQAWLEQAYGLANATSTRATIAGTGLDRIEYQEHGGYDVFKRCHHYREGCLKNWPLSGVIRYSPTTCYIHRFWRQANSAQSLPASVNHHAFADLSAAQSRAWHEMQPEFEGNVSMINFLYELGEVKALLRDSLLAIKHVRNFLTRLRRGSIKKIDVTKPIAEAHLQYNFGIKPLVDDITTIATQLYTKVIELQAQFALDGLHNNVRHYSETQVFSSTLPAESGVGFATVFQSKFTATMDYSYEYELRSSTAALIRYWGLELSAEAIWNALPFSFLLDYFIKIGKAISQMEHDPNVTLKLARYGESLKTTNSVGYHVQFISGVDWPYIINGYATYGGIHLLMGAETKLYTRQPTMPNKGIAIPMIGHLNDKKMANMAALLRCFL